ncbi:MAG: peptidase caspase catalytic subunit p20 [Rhodocyclaceae bacterium]|nr:peptidase caspase catalytic subunit p20 [Rhodocyclaceae bacterium]
MKRQSLILAFGTWLLLGLGVVHAAERRVALVIGNNDYQSVPKLEKAVNDAQAVSRELAKIGFEVISLTNAGQKKMNQAVNEFAQKVSGGGVGVFFFAGHGLQINNQNFLLPVDMDMPKDPNDVDDQAVSLVKIQDKLSEAKAKFSLLVIDACRDNPLPKKAHRSLSGTRGLAQPSSPNGQIVLFSAGANQQALDKLSDADNSPNGLFTREFLPMITSPGVSAVDALKKVRSSVTGKARSVGHDQNPALYDQTDGDFFFVAGPAPRPAAGGGGTTTTVVEASQSAIELEFWSSIKNSNDPADFKEYLSRYPNGQFASIAQRRVASTSQASTRGGGETGGGTQVAMQSQQRPPPPPSEGPTIASKVEELGKMTYLKVSDLRAAKRDNLLRVQAEVTNTSHENQQLFYRFKWLDRDGFSVWDDEPWKPLTVYGNQKQSISVVAPTFKATDFRLVLQSPNNEATSGRADGGFNPFK